MLYELLYFINHNKFRLLKILSIFSFILIFIKPIIGFSLFFIALAMLAYLDDIMKYIDGFKKESLK